MSKKENEFFYHLTPEQMMRAVESVGFIPTGEFTQLNSYENRVFDIRLEKNSTSEELNDRLIAKFYRPGRWNLSQIQEEHAFLYELAKENILVAAPLMISGSNSSVYCVEGIFVSFFSKIRGKVPQEILNQHWQKLGRSLAGIHNIGQKKNFKYRPKYDIKLMGSSALAILEKWVVPEMWSRYYQAAIKILIWLESAIKGMTQIRVHGDCHRGNLLLLSDKLSQREDFCFLDFDDCCMAPVVQDFWMLFSGDDETLNSEEEAILAGYSELRKFDQEELKIIPGLRALRIIQYAAWIAKRWQDPSFPHLFPAFQDYNYWAQEVEILEKIAWSL